MRSAVVGAGELGTACALALLANHPDREVTLLGRDVELSRSELRTDSGVPQFRIFPQQPLTVPPQLQLLDLHRAAAEDCRDTNIFICTPLPALLPVHDAWARETYGAANSPAAYSFLQRWRSPQRDAGAGHDAAFAAVLTRGLSVEGRTPAALALEAVTSAAASDAAPPVLVTSGPLFAKEWAVQSSHTGRPAITSFNGEVQDAACCPHSFSGTALTFALANPTLRGDAGLQRALAARLRAAFARESVTFLEESTTPRAAEVLGLINACAPLCAFGAGLVSNVYAGCSVAPLMSYAEHAFGATEALVNALLDRKAGTPLPLCAWSTLTLACTNHASRHFALGRRLDFYFRKQDAMAAVYSGTRHHALSATVDGLHTLLQRHAVSSPFFEVLMDAFNTLLRASTVGEGLVKAGHYAYRDASPPPLLQYAMRVDEAVHSGDEAKYDEARARITEAFPPDN